MSYIWASLSRFFMTNGFCLLTCANYFGFCALSYSWFIEVPGKDGDRAKMNHRNKMK